MHALLFATPPAWAAEACAEVAEVLAQLKPADAKIESARSKLGDAPACGYLVADVARIRLPQGAARTRVVHEALEMSRDWAPSTGPLAIGYLKAAILAAGDPTLDLPVWRERMPSHLISLRNLATLREMAEFEAALAKRYVPMLDNPFAIGDCDRLPDTVPAETRGKLAEACAARRELLAACEALQRFPETASAEAVNACETQRMKMAERFPQASGHPTMTDMAARVAQSRQALARTAQARQAQRDREAAEDRQRQQELKAQRDRQAAEERRQRQERERSRVAQLGRDEAAREVLGLFNSQVLPSFDCNAYVRKGIDHRNPTSDLLCISPQLAAADRELGVAYRDYRSRLPEFARQELLQSQRNWIAARDTTCTITFNDILDPDRRQSGIDCLLRETVARAAALR